MLARELRPAFQDAELLALHVCGRGAQRQPADEFGIRDGEDERDHAALGRAEETDLPQPQHAKRLGRVARHVVHRIGRGHIAAPVEDIDRKAILQRAVGIRNGIGRAHHALDAQPRQDDQHFPARSKAEIVHGKRGGAYGVFDNGHDKPP